MIDKILLADVRAWMVSVLVDRHPSNCNLWNAEGNLRCDCGAPKLLARLDAALQTPDHTPLVRALVAATRKHHSWQHHDGKTWDMITGPGDCDPACVFARALVAAWPEVGE